MKRILCILALSILINTLTICYLIADRFHTEQNVLVETAAMAKKIVTKYIDEGYQKIRIDLTNNGYKIEAKKTVDQP